MEIRFTHAQMDPLAARLKRLPANMRPTKISPERWAKIINGKTCRLQFAEMDAIASSLGWNLLMRTCRPK
jgi:hypothetical protein